MESSDGEWVELEQPDGRMRRVWRPDEQPPSPDGTFGSWYVVTEEGSDRWEWVSAWQWTAVEEQPALVAREEPPVPTEPPLLTRRFVLGWGAAVALTAVVVGGIALRGSSAQARPATAAELAQEIGVSFGRFEIADQGYLGRSGGLMVTFINQGRATRSFWTTIQAAGPGGVLATETLRVQDLEAGASITQPAFAADPNLSGLAAATFTVIRTDGTPPPLS